jgi:hypothetical protein
MPIPGSRPDAGLARDLERMALDFARELRTAVWHTEAVGTDALADLRVILEDTLTRIKDEILGGAGPWSTETAEDTAEEDDGDGDGA